MSSIYELYFSQLIPGSKLHVGVQVPYTRGEQTCDRVREHRGNCVSIHIYMATAGCLREDPQFALSNQNTREASRNGGLRKDTWIVYRTYGGEKWEVMTSREMMTSTTRNDDVKWSTLYVYLYIERGQNECKATKNNGTTLGTFAQAYCLLFTNQLHH